MFLRRRGSASDPLPVRTRRRVGTGSFVCVLTLSACAAGEHDPGRSPTHSSSPTVMAKGPDWPLVWSDDFEGVALDPRKWKAEDQSTYGDGNLELACLMDRPANIAVSDGLLRITAQREVEPMPCGDKDARFPQGRGFTSGMVSTRDRASWMHGRFEIRARLPMGAGRSKGLWSAVWMRPVEGGAGEIDIMEAIGTDEVRPLADRVVQTLWGDTAATPKEKASTEVAVPPPGTDTEFHIYGIVWTESSLTFTVDGVQTMQVTAQDTPWFARTFDRAYFLRLNLAVGGRWPGEPTDATEFPAAMEIDWVRVYRGAD